MVAAAVAVVLGEVDLVVAAVLPPRIRPPP